MKQPLDALAEYQNKIVDLSRRNRLLKSPKNSKTIKFNMSLEHFLRQFGELDELCINLPHRHILNKEYRNVPVDANVSEEDANYLHMIDPKGDELINLINKLRLETKRKFEEHGLHTLFISIGRIRWKEPSVGIRRSTNVVEEYDYDAPLLLIPISIEEKRNPKTSIIFTNLEAADITVNKALSLLLAKEYNSRYLEINCGEEFNSLNIYSNVRVQVEEIFYELKLEFELVDEIQIGQYSFLGQQIYEDLEQNKESFIHHEFISALFSKSQLKQDNLVLELENPDELLAVQSDFNVMDADRSQLQVIQDVINGNHLNAQGPPGTGKSQTIVNLIANLLARKKTVLLVCEKQIALEVVLNRLKESKLDKLCLPLFKYNMDKKAFAKSIIEDRDSIIRFSEKINEAESLNNPLLDRMKRIQQLRTYAKALSENIVPLSKSLYWVHGEWSKHANAFSDNTITWKGQDPLTITFDKYQKIIRALENITPLYNITKNDKFSYWKNVRKHYFSPDFVNRVNQSLETIYKLVLSANFSNRLICINSIEDLKRISQLDILEIDSDSLDKLSITNGQLPDTLALIADAIKQVECYRRLKQSFSRGYNIPFGWNQRAITEFDNYLNESIKISEIRKANLDTPLLVRQLSSINDTCKALFMNEISLKQLLSYKDILKPYSFLKIIKNWNNLDVLESVIDQLNNLSAISDYFNKAKRTLDKWGIIYTQIDTKLIAEISGRFENSYNTFIRYFNSQYSKDCKFIAACCNVADTPKSYIDCSQVIFAIRDYLKLQDKFKNLLEHFNYKYVQSEELLKPSQISSLYENVKEILSWLNHQEQDKLLPEVAELVTIGNNSLLISNLQGELKDIARILNSSWKILALDENISTAELVKKLLLLQESMQNKLKIDKFIRDICKENETDDLSVKQLKQIACEIDKLFLELEKLQQIQSQNVFNQKDILFNSIDCPDHLKKLQANIQKAFEIAKISCCLDGNDVTVKCVIQCVEELRCIVPQSRRWFESYISEVQELNKLFENNQSIEHLEGLHFSELLNVLRGMINEKQELENWMLYQRYANQLEKLGHSWFLEETRDKSISNPVSLFAYTLWTSWLDAYYAQKPVLHNFNVNDHERAIAEFRTLEQESLHINACRIMEAYAPSLKMAKLYSGAEDKLITRQSELKIRHKPIRKLVRETGKQLIKYKPCWMMSPLTLSSYIPYTSLNFDVVIFDEASQMRVEHSLAAIARARQVVIFGDENQLPPTSFFEVNNDDENEEAVDSYESILQATKEILPGANSLLSYHYRSKYEELIAFSNHHVYGDRLITFPSPNRSHKAIEFVYVENGLYDGGKGGTRQNIAEARQVIKSCIKHITEYPEKSLGVIAFSKSQEICIRDALQKYLRENSLHQSLLDETSNLPQPFFIKNLESVQGDERDVIILSIGYGRDKITNEVYNRFGPLNSQHGYRRLNVAITRAKEKIICVSSIKAGDIRNIDKSRGAFLLQKYLEYAERGLEALDASRLIQDQIGIKLDSPFEEEVEKALQNRGYIVHRQIGVSGFKIDLGIVHPKNNQEYILGVECDGASYHSSYSARMNDRIRQDILERLGWKLYRIWSQHWISHKEEIIEDIVKNISLEI